MRWETLVAGRTGRIRVEGASFRYEREDGGAFEGSFSLEKLEPGCFSVLIGGRSYRVTAAAAGEVAVNGVPISVTVFDPRGLRGRKTGAASTGRHHVSAPMPGKVVRVLVAQGDAVEAGQGLVVVEAMKMQNEMKSPKSGRVAEVRTRPDAPVTAGEVLVIVE